MNSPGWREGEAADECRAVARGDARWCQRHRRRPRCCCHSCLAARSRRARPSCAVASNHAAAAVSSVKPQVDAKARLIAFPHAGGSAAAYRDWELPAELELWAVQPAGRGARYSVRAATSLDELRDEVIEALKPTLDTGVPFAFFGHSFGCVLAVEVARALDQRALPLPLVLLLSALAIYMTCALAIYWQWGSRWSQRRGCHFRGLWPCAALLDAAALEQPM